MFTVKRGREVSSAQAECLLDEMESKFDLMRLRARRAELEQKEIRLKEKQEKILKSRAQLPSVHTAEVPENPADALGLRWRRLLRSRVISWWLGLRREMLVEQQRQCLLLEEEIKFALRVRGATLHDLTIAGHTQENDRCGQRDY